MNVKGYRIKDIIDELLERYHNGDEEIGAHEIEEMLFDCEIDDFSFNIYSGWEPLMFKKRAVVVKSYEEKQKVSCK